MGQLGTDIGQVYTAAFSAVALTTNPVDAFCLLAPATSRVQVREIKLTQSSEFGDAQAEMVTVQLLRGSTATPSTGIGVTPQHRNGWVGTVTPGSSVQAMSSGLASTASAVLIEAEAFNVAVGYRHYPAPEERIVLDMSQRLLVRIPTGVADAMTMSGFITFEEVGKAV